MYAIPVHAQQAEHICSLVTHTCIILHIVYISFVVTHVTEAHWNKALRQCTWVCGSFTTGSGHGSSYWRTVSHPSD